MSVFRVGKNLILSYLVVVLLAGVAQIQAQSLDARTPSPIHTNEVVGRIDARDIGDARLTDHFYAFTGAPGDLLITIETRNLNGDIDVFTAGALRPVLKVALYAELNAPVTKSIFLRNREDLILRVEARTPNDDDGTYHISFAGSFEPVTALKDDGGSELASAPPATRKGKRVSSVGARVEAPSPPPLEVAETPRPEPSPTVVFDPPPVEPRAAKTPPAETPVVEPRVDTALETRPSAGRNARSRTATRRGPGRPAVTEEAAKKSVRDETTKREVPREEPNKREAVSEIPEKRVTPTKRSKKSSETAEVPEETAEISEKPAAPSKRSKKSRVTAETPLQTDPAPATRESVTVSKRPERTRSQPEKEEATAQPEDLSRSKLIIELLDGTRIERLMNTVKRVDVESGQIAITAMDGSVERIRLARVVRMSIGP